MWDACTHQQQSEAVDKNFDISYCFCFVFLFLLLFCLVISISAVKLGILKMWF